MFFNEFSTCSKNNFWKDKVVECPFWSQFKKKVVCRRTACQPSFMPWSSAIVAEVCCEAVSKNIVFLRPFFGNEGFNGLTEEGLVT
jgi:hypothetical protein